MNFTTLCKKAMMLEAGSNWAALANPPNNYVLNKRAAKSLKKDHTLRAAFDKAMRSWDVKRAGRSWEAIVHKYANDRLSVDRGIRVVAFDLGGANHNRALGFIDANNDYQILEVMTHEDYNKYVG